MHPAPHRIPRSAWTSLGTALFAAVMAGVVGWLLLRQPQLRQWLVDLVPHRYPVDMTVQRQLLAPRSILLAGLLSAATFAAMLAVPRLRAGLFRPMPLPEWLATVAAALGLMLAVASVISQEAFFLRRFGAPSVGAGRDRVARYLMPQAVDDALLLRRKLEGAGPGPTLESGDGRMHNLYLVNALAYPLAFREPATSPTQVRTRIIYHSERRDDPFDIIPVGAR